MAPVRLRSRSRRSSVPARAEPFDAWTTVGNLDSRARAMVDPSGRVAVAGCGLVARLVDRCRGPLAPAGRGGGRPPAARRLEPGRRDPGPHPHRRRGVARRTARAARAARTWSWSRCRTTARCRSRWPWRCSAHDGDGRVDSAGAGGHGPRGGRRAGGAPGPVARSLRAARRRPTRATPATSCSRATRSRCAPRSVTCATATREACCCSRSPTPPRCGSRSCSTAPARAIDPTELPSARQVASGWATHSRGGARIEVPDRRLREAIAASTRFLLLDGDGPLGRSCARPAGLPRRGRPAAPARRVGCARDRAGRASGSMAPPSDRAAATVRASGWPAPSSDGHPTPTRDGRLGAPRHRRPARARGRGSGRGRCAVAGGIDRLTAGRRTARARSAARPRRARTRPTQRAGCCWPCAPTSSSELDDGLALSPDRAGRLAGPGLGGARPADRVRPALVRHPVARRATGAALGARAPRRRRLRASDHAGARPAVVDPRRPRRGAPRAGAGARAAQPATGAHDPGHDRAGAAAAVSPPSPPIEELVALLRAFGVPDEEIDAGAGRRQPRAARHRPPRPRPGPPLRRGRRVRGHRAPGGGAAPHLAIARLPRPEAGRAGVLRRRPRQPRGGRRPDAQRRGEPGGHLRDDPGDRVVDGPHRVGARSTR